MAGRPAAGVPSPGSPVAEPGRSKERHTWTYPSDRPVHGAAKGDHAHARHQTVYAGVEHRADVVPSLHPCPWTMRVKEPRISYDGVRGVAASPVSSKPGSSPLVKARNLEHQWNLDEAGGEAGVAAHDTRGPIGHDCHAHTSTPKHARKAFARYQLHVDGTPIYIPHDGEPEKSVPQEPGAQPPSRPRGSRLVHFATGPSSTAAPSSRASLNRFERANRATDDLRKRREKLAPREAGWVESLREHGSQSAAGGGETSDRPGSLEPDDQSAELAPATENRPAAPTPILGHPLFDMLAAAISGAAPAPVESVEHSIGGCVAEQPWWNADSDEEEVKDYPKPWRENMKLQPPNSSAASARTAERNPLAHLQTDTDDRDRPSVLSDQAAAPIHDIAIKRALSMPGGAKLRSSDAHAEHRTVSEESSPWRWSAERERAAIQRSAQRSDRTAPARSRRAVSPGGSPVRGGAA